MCVFQNPMMSVPGSPMVAKALAKLETLVVIDTMPSETAQLADYVLPGTNYLERLRPLHPLGDLRSALGLRQPVVNLSSVSLPNMDRRCTWTTSRLKDQKWQRVLPHRTAFRPAHRKSDRMVRKLSLKGIEGRWARHHARRTEAASWRSLSGQEGHTLRKVFGTNSRRKASDLLVRRRSRRRRDRHFSINRRTKAASA